MTPARVAAGKSIKGVMEYKTHTLKFRAINRDIFEAVRVGKKRVETRAASLRYLNIKSGDVIDFVCGNSRFQKTVKRAAIFQSVFVMLKKYKIIDIMLTATSVEDLQKAYDSFLGYREKIKKFGIIALEFK